MKRGASFEIIYKNLDANTRRRIDDSIEELHQTHTKAIKEARESETRCGIETMKISGIALILLVLLLFVFEKTTMAYYIGGLIFISAFVLIMGLCAYGNMEF